jgi:hypothetical protein
MQSLSIYKIYDCGSKLYEKQYLTKKWQKVINIYLTSSNLFFNIEFPYNIEF